MEADPHSNWFDEPQPTPSRGIESPCIRRCTLDEDDLCVGCGRLIGEILEWAAAPTDRKRAIRADAATRLEQRRIRAQR